MSKAARLIFVASLVLNLLLLGVILGQVPRASAPPSGRQQRMEEELKKLPEPMQSRLRQKFAEIRAAGDPARQQIDEARAETLRLLAADPFDEAAYDRQVRRLEELRAEAFKGLGRSIKQIVKDLSPEERRTFADILRRPPPGKP